MINFHIGTGGDKTRKVSIHRSWLTAAGLLHKTDEGILKIRCRRFIPAVARLHPRILIDPGVVAEALETPGPVMT
jgi:hypothetical protein